MQINVTDSQTVGETSAVITTLVQPASTPTAVFLTNAGTNALTYRYQEFDGETWNDLDVPGTPANGALIAGGSATVLIKSTSTQVRLVGNASGGTVVQFSVSRLATRAPGAALPILTM